MPETFGQLTRPRGSHTSGYQLACLPETLGQLTGPANLGIYGNALPSMSGTFGHLTSLTAREIYWNELAALPETYGQLTRPRGLHISTKSERPKTLAIPTNLESPTDLHSQDQKRSEGSDSEDMDSEDSMGNSLGVEMVAPLAKLVSIQQQIVVCAPLPSTLVYNRVKHMGFVGGEAVQLTCHQTQSTRE